MLQRIQPKYPPTANRSCPLCAGLHQFVKPSSGECKAPGLHRVMCVRGTLYCPGCDELSVAPAGVVLGDLINTDCIAEELQKAGLLAG